VIEPTVNPVFWRTSRIISPPIFDASISDRRVALCTLFEDHLSVALVILFLQIQTRLPVCSVELPVIFPEAILILSAISGACQALAGFTPGVVAILAAGPFRELA
jgi:hypothetical protein